MINLIFDVDGTLIDSYTSIIDRINKTFDHFGIHFSYEESYDKVIHSTSGSYIDFVVNKYGLDKQKVNEYYDSLISDLDSIILMPKVKETLDKLYQNNVRLFIYTHRGKSLSYVLDKLDIKKYFIEILDSTSGFKRKPSGDAIRYLVNKYNMNSNETYYVGDRELDILCAIDANVKSVFYESAGITINSKATHYIKSFDELISLFA